MSKMIPLDIRMIDVIQSTLLSKLREKDKRGLFVSNDNCISYPTGILPLDYANGFRQQVTMPDGTIVYEPILGIMGGTFTSIIGSTGTGKSSLADQIAFNIIKNFENGLMFHVDAERTALRQRIISLTGANMDDERIILKKENTTVEDILELINEICEEKERGGNEYKYEAPNHTYNGKKFKVYFPTIIIIDSVVSFNSKEYSTDDLGTNMDGARSAKVLTRFVNNCLDKMLKYNITVLMISHIRPKVEANPYASAPPGLMLLKPGEMVPGGTNFQYMMQNFFRINMTKSNGYTFADDGFDGFKGTIQIAKSKTNFVGATIPVTFNAAIGFDPIFSLYEYASSIGLIQGRNPNLYFEGLDTFKFSRRNFRKIFIDQKDFRDEIMRILHPHLDALLGTKIVTDDDKIRFGDLISPTEIVGAGESAMSKTPKKVKKAD